MFSYQGLNAPIKPFYCFMEAQSCFTVATVKRALSVPPDLQNG